MTVARAIGELTRRMHVGYALSCWGTVPVYVGFKRDAMTDTFIGVHVCRCPDKTVIVIHAGRGVQYAIIKLEAYLPWGYGVVETTTYLGHEPQTSHTGILSPSQVEKFLNNLRRLLEGGKK